ncbi:MAG: hypothetical protein BGO49_20680 [Planctomycetales bacterium 71-10]|nr:MAG: hypothetical protein BGO49_20680 [Planctomycetales bacterium 71-10]
MADEAFELRVQADGESQYGLALFQKPSRDQSRNGMTEDWQLVVKVHGQPLKAVLDQVLAAIKKAGYRATDLSRSRKEPFTLAEGLGVRLGLLLLAVKPLRKASRMADVSDQIQGMSEEEAYYWFSKATHPRAARRSQKALRILIAEE